jgi:hypothetical protein
MTMAKNWTVLTVIGKIPSMSNRRLTAKVPATFQSALAAFG